MSVMILDKETNQHITVAAGETNNRAAPVFSGTGPSQDPLKFIEDFKTWPSGTTGGPMTGSLLCLQGHAKRWVTNHLMANKEAFDAMPFEDDTKSCLLKRFRNEYITDDWYDMYLRNYEDRAQAAEEHPWNIWR